MALRDRSREGETTATEAAEGTLAPIHNDPIARTLSSSNDRQALQAALTSLLAWGITVAPAAFARSSSSLAQVAALFAVLAGVGGPWFFKFRPRLGRHLGLSVFLACTTVTWLLAPSGIHPDRLDPVRASLGSIAWGLFALSWRAARPRGGRSDVEVSEPQLEARARLSRTALPVAAIGVVAALACVGLAWSARELERALLGQAIALAAATALVSGAATIAIGRNRGRARTPAVSSSAWRALLALIAVIFVGLGLFLR